uniref:ARAD1A17666p n=1 Tax=Blastobotrys adeninivorans TaxID=409370 RepID=A0A060SYK8_BLAAD
MNLRSRRTVASGASGGVNESDTASVRRLRRGTVPREVAEYTPRKLPNRDKSDSRHEMRTRSRSRTSRARIAAKLTPPPTSDEEDEIVVPKPKGRSTVVSDTEEEDQQANVGSEVEAPEKSPQELRRIIARQFDFEILLKHQELKRIERQIHSVESMMARIRQPSVSQVLEIRSDARRPPRKSSCCHRRSDGKLVKLQCPECYRTNFNTMEGFIAHCKKVHSMNVANNETSLTKFSVPYEKSASPDGFDSNNCDALESALPVNRPVPVSCYTHDPFAYSGPRRPSDRLSPGPACAGRLMAHAKSKGMNEGDVNKLLTDATTKHPLDDDYDHDNDDEDNEDPDQPRPVKKAKASVEEKKNVFASLSRMMRSRFL